MNLESFNRLRHDLRWKLLPPEFRISPEKGVKDDESYLRLNGDYGFLRVWQSSQALIATAKESHMPNFAEAAEALGREGWPVHVRRTGGSCVPQGPGVLNLSMIYPTIDVWNIEESYEFLGYPLELLFRGLGFNPEYGAVDGSFCDGRYNIQIDGQKIVGTAQRWRRNSETGQGYVLAHACILVDIDLQDATQKINELYSRCEQQTRFRTDACVSLHEIMDGVDTAEGSDLLESTAKQLVEILKAKFSPYS